MDKRKYTKEFKVEAVQLAAKIGVPRASKDLGVSDSAFYKWRKDHVAHGNGAFPGHGRLRPEDEEMRRLRRENDLLREEREILKKATVFFARVSR